MNWWTFGIAVIGAVTGTYGAVVATLGRRDVKWRRAGKQAPELRDALEALRDAVAQGQRGSRTLASLRENPLRANLDLIQETRDRLSDKKFSTALVRVDHGYSALLALADDTTGHREVSALATAAEAIDAALQRLSHIERKAPP